MKHIFHEPLAWGYLLSKTMCCRHWRWRWRLTWEKEVKDDGKFSTSDVHDKRRTNTVECTGPWLFRYGVILTPLKEVSVFMICLYSFSFRHHSRYHIGRLSHLVIFHNGSTYTTYCDSVKPNVFSMRPSSNCANELENSQAKKWKICK